jgi:hypothetical protein
MNRTSFYILVGGAFLCAGILIARKDWWLGSALGGLAAVMLTLGRE